MHNSTLLCQWCILLTQSNTKTWLIFFKVCQSGKYLVKFFGHKLHVQMKTCFQGKQGAPSSNFCQKSRRAWRCRNNTTGYAGRQQEYVFTQFHRILPYGVSNAADHHENTNKPLNSTASKMTSVLAALAYIFKTLQNLVIFEIKIAEWDLHCCSNRHYRELKYNIII